ncbi:coiled-coil domain-containing protein [Sutterella megalosphaeroides]|uniref:AAA+ ATPase domain-containing protein n=1 Tax=Sutterella megalosphaeroides TaxID=2494234 RepID=A0A2Z6IAK2_9BURK|nr:hypothetical protein [Sutterella megalosphaeroides]BBF23551.1 hypothetical protein SUTMEG_14420 [Sutterella megalosphaeroides]
MYSLSSLLKVFADQVDKAELRRLTKQALKSGMTLQKLVKASNFFKGEAFYRQFERCILEGRPLERGLLGKLSPYPVTPDAAAMRRACPDIDRAFPGNGKPPLFEPWCRALTEMAKESKFSPEAYLRYAMITSLEVYRRDLLPTTPLSVRADFFEDVMLGFLWFAKNAPFSKEAAEKLLERLGETDDERLEDAFRTLCGLDAAIPDEAGDGTDSGAQSEAKDEAKDEEAEPSDEKEPARSPATVEPVSDPSDSRPSRLSRPVTLSAVARRVDPRKIRTKRKEREYVLAAAREAAKKLGRELAAKAEKTAKAPEVFEREKAEASEARAPAATTVEVEPEPESASAVTPHAGAIDEPDVPETTDRTDRPETPAAAPVAASSSAPSSSSSSPSERPADLFALDPSAANRTVFDLPCAPESGHGASSATDGAGSTAEPALCERLPKPAYGRARVLAYVRRAGTFMNLFFTHRFDALGNYVKHDFTSEFPRLGAANLRTHRKARLQEGAFYVCDLESDDSFVNRDAGSGAPRKDFERAIDYDRLAAEGRLHPLEDDAGFLVVRPRVEDINLEKDILVRFRPEGAEMSDSDGDDVADEGLTHLHVRNVPVLLAVGNRYYGPVKLKEDGQQRPYVNLVTRDANARRGLVAGFLRDDPAIRTLRVVEECVTASCPVEIAFAAGATPKLFDVLSDATLAEKVLPSVLAAGPEVWMNRAAELSGGDPHESPIAALPPEAQTYVTTDPAIAKTRLMRIARLLTVRRMGAEAVEVVGRAIAELLDNSLDAKSPGGRIVGRIANRIATTPELAKKIEGYGELARRIEDLKTEIGRLETSLKATESVAEREAERVRREAEERNRTLLDETERLEAKLAEKTRVLGNIEASADLVAMRNDLEASLATLADEEKRLRTEAKAAEAYLENALERARNFAFDGVFAEKLLEAAGSRKRAQETLRIETRVRETAARPRFEADPVTLARTLVADVQRLRDYDRLTILNLFILLTQNFLTVLSGPPGAGKTSISVILGDVLGLTEKSERSDGSYNSDRSDRTGGSDHAESMEKAESTESTERFLPVSVERGWTSKRDFLGYWNPLSKTFESPDPRRSDALALLDAEARAGFDDLPFVMLLDEANLSPMEYYWGDFMRICDDRSRMNRIALGGDALYDVPDTLRFLATINSDFTTENLSPRLLDRAPVVTLPETEPDFANLGDRGASYDDGATDEGTHGSDDAPRPPVSWRAMRAAFGPRAHFEGEAEALALLEDVVAAFRATGGVTSVRTRRAMRDYVSSAVPVFCEADAGGNGATTGGASSKLSKLSKFPTATQKTIQKARGKSTLKAAEVKAVNAVTAASASQSASQGASARLSVTDAVRAAVDFAVAARLLPRIEGSGDAYREKLETFGETLAVLGLTRSRSILDGILARGESALGWYRFF